MRMQSTELPSHERAPVNAQIHHIVTKPLRYIWRPGAEAGYHLRWETFLQGGDSGWRAEAIGNRIFLEVDWYLRVLEVGTDHVRLLSLFTNAQVTNGEQPAVHWQRLLEDTPVVLTWHRSGRTLGVEFPEAIAMEDRAIYHGVMTVEVILPESSETLVWELERQDNNGTYWDAYQILQNGTIRKSKLRYTKLEGGLPDASINVRSSLAEAIPGEFWLDDYRGTEELDYRQGKQTILQSKTQTTLRRISGDHPRVKELFPPAWDYPAVLAAVRRFIPAFLQNGGGSARAAQETAVRRERLAHTSLTSIVDELRKLGETETSQAEKVPAMYALRDWLLSYPEAAEEVRTLLEDTNLTLETTSMLIHALELAAAQPEAQEALARILQNPMGYPSEVYLQAIVAAGGVGVLQSTLLQETLWRIAMQVPEGGREDIHDAALLALGILSRDNPALRKPLMEALWPNLQDDAVFQDKVSAMQTLANSRIYSEEAVSRAVTFLTPESHTEAPLQIASLQYLIYSQAWNIGQYTQAIDTLENPQVKARAVELLDRYDNWPVETLTCLERLMLSDVQPLEVRAAAVKSLQKGAEQIPTAAAILENALADPAFPPELKETMFPTDAPPTGREEVTP